MIQPMRDWLPVVLAVAVIGLLTAGATAVRSVSRIRLRHLVERGLTGVKAAELYLERPQRLLGSAASAVALACVAAGVWLGAREGHDVGRVVAVVALTALAILVVGQVVPRVIGRRYDASLLPVLLPVLRFSTLVTVPVNPLARLVERVLRGAAPPASPATARDGIEDLLREGELEGVGERDEIAIISGVVDFAEKSAADVMTPRERVFALDASLPPREAAMRIAESAYSRVPIFRGTLDDVIGMTHAFDVLRVGGSAIPPLRPVSLTTPDAPCNSLLARMLSERRHLAVVRDAGGRTVGIVTLEDLLEALVGDIRDEHDEAAPEPIVVAAADALPARSVARSAIARRDDATPPAP
jgi:putative hemolysin